MNALINFAKEVRHELTKVTWPKRSVVVNYLGLVISISIFVAFFVGIVDYGLTRSLEYLLSR